MDLPANSHSKTKEYKHILRLKCDGYDPFIDYLKGICILLVILTHCLPDLWGGTAVPIFLIIQVFHTYKKGLDNVKINFNKLWNRIIKPFLLTEIILIVIGLGSKILTGQSDNLLSYLSNVAKLGGRGSGAYYPWIYIEFALLLPIIAPILKKINGIYLAIAFIIISELFEIMCSLMNMPEFIYRILFFRYTFLIYLGYLLVIKGYILNWKTLLVSIISASSILLFVYTKTDLSPFIYNVSKWKPYHWICYFYIAFFLLFFFKFIYQRTIRFGKICEYIKKMGRYSFEIFLFQMIFFEFHKYIVKLLSTITVNYWAATILPIISAIIICVVPVVFYKDYSLSKQQHR